jgi:hypothetical protein
MWNTLAPLSVALATTFGVKISVKPRASSVSRKPRVACAASCATARRFG